jgi:hypothetical protein
MSIIQRTNSEAGAHGRRAAVICVLFIFALTVHGSAAVPFPGGGGGITNHHARPFVYQHFDVSEVPWSIHVLKISRAHPELEFCTTLGKGNVFGMAVVSEQVKNIPEELGEPLAAVNGDFFGNNDHYSGDPRDLQIHEGELVSGPAGHASFWIDPDGNPHIATVSSRFHVAWPDGTQTRFGLNEERDSDSAVLFTAAVGPSTRTSGGLELVLEPVDEKNWVPLQAGKTCKARVKELRKSGNTPLTKEIMVLSIGSGLYGRIPKIERGAVLAISTETSPDLTGVRTAIGGGPTLVRDSKPMQWTGLQPRHPRSAIGWNKEFFFLFEVDGRQNNLSVGMNFPELANYMLKLGCTDAMNLDGGGSATFWASGNVMNSPCEGHERPAPNALVLVRKKK